MRDLVNVEAIPFDVLDAGITWDWETFPEFIDAAARRRPSLNLGFLAPLTPFRHYVMGEASMERAATPDGDRADQGAARRGHRRRRVRLLDHDPQPAHRLPGAPARLPQRQPRRAQGLRQRAQGARQGRDRDRADAQDRGDGRRGVRAARLPAARERPAGDLPRAVRPRRHPGGGARHAAQGGAADRPRRAAADLAAAADPRDQHAQPVLLRRLPELEPRVRRTSRSRPRPPSTPTPPSATSSARS